MKSLDMYYNAGYSNACYITGVTLLMHKEDCNLPPKAKVSKEDIITAALNLVRRDGASKLNARAIAKELKCSTQPIFSLYSTMDELKAAVAKAANSYCDEFMRKYTARRDISPYGASGLAYIQLAKEEKELFKLLFMTDNIYGQSWESDHDQQQIEMIMATTGLLKDSATKLNLQIRLFAHGIATMYVTSHLKLSDELVLELMTNTFTRAFEVYKADIKENVEENKGEEDKSIIKAKVSRIKVKVDRNNRHDS